MDSLLCTDCGTTFYSAAARQMAERGERCDCGGPLELRTGSGPLVAVGAGSSPECAGAPRRTLRRRRFAR
jgi:hypothetical protein